MRGVVDHFAISVENFNRDAVTEQPKQHNLTPQQNGQFLQKPFTPPVLAQKVREVLDEAATA